jgi:hypothetical protein
MIHRLLLLSLCATIPSLVCAQQPQLLNCRTLQAANNFVGSNEVLVNDMVCEVAKPSAATPATEKNNSASAPSANTSQTEPDTERATARESSADNGEVATASSPAATPPTEETGTGFYDANAPTMARAAAPVRLAVPKKTTAPKNARAIETGMFAEPKEVANPGPDAPDAATVLAGAATTDEVQQSDCAKNITIAGLQSGKLILGTPSWAAQWIEKNQNTMPQVCFSTTPVKTAKNYLVVFYTAQASASQIIPLNDNRAFFLSSGSNWRYAPQGAAAETIIARDDSAQPQSNLSQVRYATAYSERGAAVAERWPENQNAAASATLLTQILEDLTRP